MTLIQWQDSFSLGIPSVDYEHRSMIELINELYSRLGEGAEPPEILDFLGEVHSRIAAHFALEERVMWEHGYDQYEEHKTAHEALLDDILNISDAYEGEPRPDYQEVLGAELEAWFGSHFRTHDARLHKMLK